MKVSFTETGTELKLIFQGECTVEGAEAARSDLMGLFALNAPLLVLDLSLLTKVDVTFFQLLLAFRRSLLDQGKELLVLKLPADHRVITTGELLGFYFDHYFPVGEESL